MAEPERMKILVTGGAGFIGSAVVRQLVLEADTIVINVDKLTYAGNLDSLAGARHHPNHRFERIDIRDKQALERCFREHRPNAVMHLAAESHVDRSIVCAEDFIQSNIVGTYNLLEVCRTYWSELGGRERVGFRLHHVSTDEVYGDLDSSAAPFTEETPYAPSSPYSASKASSDHMVRAWQRTYGLPIVITNCSNNYGPYQFPEKLIPLVILNALHSKELPLYGKGDNIRDWLYVGDHVRALRAVLARGREGETYNIGGKCEKSNLEVVRMICDCLDRLAKDPSGPYERLIRFVADRPGHDRRYAIDHTKVSRELGWEPVESFESGLEKTVLWYLENPEWVERVRTGKYRDWLDVSRVTRQVV